MNRTKRMLWVGLFLLSCGGLWGCNPCTSPVVFTNRACLTFKDKGGVDIIPEKVVQIDSTGQEQTLTLDQPPQQGQRCVSVWGSKVTFKATYKGQTLRAIAYSAQRFQGFRKRVASWDPDYRAKVLASLDQ